MSAYMPPQSPYPGRQTPLMPRSGFDTARTLCAIFLKVLIKILDKNQ
jgi:hypothetical protein